MAFFHANILAWIASIQLAVAAQLGFAFPSQPGFPAWRLVFNWWRACLESTHAHTYCSLLSLYYSIRKIVLMCVGDNKCILVVSDGWNPHNDNTMMNLDWHAMLLTVCSLISIAHWEQMYFRLVLFTHWRVFPRVPNDLRDIRKKMC